MIVDDKSYSKLTHLHLPLAYVSATEPLSVNDPIDTINTTVKHSGLEVEAGIAQHSINPSPLVKVGDGNQEGLLMTRVQIGAASLASLIAMIQSGAAFAQGAPANPPAEAKSPASEEIVVTAQRRTGTLERTPVAISVLTGDTLARRAIVTESDLQVASPGLTVRAGQNSNQLNYALRGQSLDAFSDTRPGVLPYFDEIQLDGVGGGSSAFYDLQSVQVLKGPQGTLFGRNSTGGAVLFTSVRPSDTFGGYISGRLGNYNLRQIEGAINVPIMADKVMARVAGFYEKRDGYQRNLFQNNRAGNVDRYGLRGSLTVNFTNQIKNELVVDYLHSGGNSLSGLINSLDPSGAVPLILLTNFGNQPQYNFLINAFTGGAAGCNSTTNNCAAAFAAANPKLDPGGVASYLNTQNARGPYVIETDGENKYKGRNLILSNITTFELAPDTKLRNIFGYTRIEANSSGDIDGTPFGIDSNGPNGGKNDKTKQYSEELQLGGKAFDGKLNYVVGGFYSHETNVDLTTSLLLEFPPLTSTTRYHKLTTRDMYAGYGQGTFDLSNATGVKGLSATLGARFTHEKIKFDVLPDDTAFQAPPAQQAIFNFNQQKSYSNVSWTLGLEDQVNSNLLIYVASRRSYKNGGYNGIQDPVPGPGSTGGDGYGQETLTDAEVGLKYHGQVGDMPTQLNLAVYQDWIKQGQRVAYVLLGSTPAAVTVNVPKSKVSGFELDGTIRPAKWLSMGGSLNYTNGRFTDGRVSINGNPVLFATYPDTPKWSGSVFAELQAPIHGSVTASLRGDLYSQSSFYFSSTANNNTGARINGYSLTNFRLGIEDSNAGWSLAANLKNAFNRVYYVGGIATGELFQFNTVVPGAPRTFLMEARFKF